MQLNIFIFPVKINALEKRDFKIQYNSDKLLTRLSIFVKFTKSLITFSNKNLSSNLAFVRLYSSSKIRLPKACIWARNEVKKILKISQRVQILFTLQIDAVFLLTLYHLLNDYQVKHSLNNDEDAGRTLSAALCWNYRAISGYQIPRRRAYVVPTIYLYMISTGGASGPRHHHQTIQAPTGTTTACVFAVNECNPQSAQLLLARPVVFQFS